jgi:hypothetical protein
MPGYKGHIVGGVFAFALVYFFLFVMCVYVYPCVFAFELLCMTVLGALFPDIDIKSKGQRYFYLFLFLFSLFLLITQRYFVAAIVGISGMVPLIGPHRGIFHNPIFLIGLVASLWLLLYLLFGAQVFCIRYHIVFFISGMLSHVWLDFGTKRFLKKLWLR